MAEKASDPKAPQPGGLQAMLARLRGMVQALKATETEEPSQQELLPTWDQATTANTEPPPGLAGTMPAGDVAQGPSSEEAAHAEPGVTAEASHEGAAPVRALQLCPHCQSPRSDEQTYCDNCGWIFPPPSSQPAPSPEQETRLKNRYELGQRFGERGGLARYRGYDHGAGGPEPVPVILLRAPISQPVEAIAKIEESAAEPAQSIVEVGLSPGEESAPPAIAEAVPLVPEWPSIGWERSLLEKVHHPALPQVVDHFIEEGFEYLAEELPAGQALWDAWDDPNATADQRFRWLQLIAEALDQLHQNGAILEALRPDIVVITGAGQPRLTDLSDLLPLPVPPSAAIRATCYTAPELVLSCDKADARADLYSFGAMLYALHLGRELTELDFELQGVPKSFIHRFPDAHPLFARLVSKTFCRNPDARFPTEESAKDDPSGFKELLRTLEMCRRTLDHVRLEIAAWTTTGMVRTGNEDAFALLHAVESRENELGDSALVFLADGMGGSEAGEVAAALAIQALRKSLLQQKMFAVFAGESALSSARAAPAGGASTSRDVDTCKLLLLAALKDANQQVYEASHSGTGRKGMGCTAEVVYVDGRHVVVGHVGDSRTYHLHEGRLIQLTRDQTWVNRMVELGALTAEEAEKHPRRSELQQAVGGQPDVDPEIYDSTLKPGDWVVVCSDGLSNHTAPDLLKDMLQSAKSAESAARRLVNHVNLQGATDNATVVVIRAT